MRAPEFPKPHPEPRAPSRGPRALARQLMGPLVVYHALILGGAFLIVVAGGWGIWQIVGVALVVLGISVEVAVLAWTASLTRTAARESPSPAGPWASPRPDEASRICVACARKSRERTRICPQCGRATVSLGRVQ